MCLAVKYDKPCRSRKGWKIFKKGKSGTLCTGICGGAQYSFRPGIELRDRSTVRISSSGDSFNYPPGFHIFLRKSQAERVLECLGGKLVLAPVRFPRPSSYGEVQWTFRSGLRLDTFSTVTVVSKRCTVIATN